MWRQIGKPHLLQGVLYLSEDEEDPKLAFKFYCDGNNNDDGR
ncbi:unnamed protein product, partial [Allacma fusca]